MTDRLVSNSEIYDFKRCRRRWWLRHVRRLQPKVLDVVGARALGDRIHDVLAAYYDPRFVECDRAVDVLALWDYETQQLLEAAGENMYKAKDVADDSDLGRAMLEGYFEWLEEKGEDEDLEIIGSEREIDVPFTDGVRLVGKLDVRVLQKSTRARRFIDHKSVANMTDLPKTADIAEQFLHYCLLDLLEHLNAGDHSDATFVDGGIYNMLRKVKRTPRATPPFYLRHPVRHTREELRSYWLRLLGEVAEIMRAEERLLGGEDPLVVAYPTPTRDCSWDCEMRQVCPMFDRPQEDAEGYLRDVFVQVDPLERYKTVSRD